MSDEKRPPRIVKDTPPDPELRTVTYRMVDKQIVGTRVPVAQAEAIAAELNADGGQGRWHRLNDPSGRIVLINPAHIVTMEIQ